MRRTLLPCGVIAWALLQGVALASPQPTARRIGALLIPLDPGAEAQTVQLEADLDDALSRDPALQVKRAEDLFGLPVDPEAALALKRADTGYEESLAAFNDHDAEDAERKLRATLKEYQKAAGAMIGCGHYCDAIAIYGAVMNQRGELDEARLALLDLMALAPTYALSPQRFGRDYLGLRASVGTSPNAALRGTAAVRTRPSGARVFLDNAFVGFSPLTLPQQQIGKHLLRIERPGFKTSGRIVELSPEDQEVTVELTETATFRSFDALAGRLRGEIESEGGPTLVGLGQTLGLDRGVLGTVRQLPDGNATEVKLGLFDLRSGKKLAARKVVFQGDEFGQLKSEAGHAVMGLLNAVGTASSSRKAKGRDPLDQHSGMEDWSDDASPHERQASEKRKKKSRDPLDGVDGTEDW